MIGLAVGLVAGVVFESVAGKQYGRISSWQWLFARSGPNQMDHCSFITVSSIVGGGTAGVLFVLLKAPIGLRQQLT